VLNFKCNRIEKPHFLFVQKISIDSAVAYVEKKTLVRLRTLEKNKKKYLEAPKSKMAAQFKMAAFFYQIFFLLKSLSKLSKIQDGAHILCGVFLASFLEALAFVRNFKMLIFMHILEEQTQKKIKKNCCPKINSKWLLNSSWLPKLNLLVKTKNHLFQKKNKFRELKKRFQFGLNT
jgi:hypothetical protein